MCNNIKIIYDREMTLLAKKRVFALIFSVVSITLSLFVLIFINRTLVRAKAEGMLNYVDLLYLHERIWDIVFFLCILFSIFLSSMSINIEKKKYILDNILATNVKKIDIVLGKLLAYISSVLSLSFVCMPMCMLPTFFGGISYIKMVFLFMLLIFVVVFFISLTLMFSSLFLQENISLFLSILCGLFLAVVIFYFKNNIVSNMYLYICSIIFAIISSIICNIVSIRSKIFDI